MTELQPTPPTEQLEAALREAQLFFRRGALAQAQEACERVLREDEWNVAGRELYADVLTGLKRLEEALENYRIAFALDPDNERLERKLAEAALRSGERRRLQAGVEAMLAAGQDAEPRSAVVAGLLSMMFPGLGQLYTGQLIKAVVFVFAGMGLIAAFVRAVMRGIDAAAGMGAARGALSIALEAPAVWWLAGLVLLMVAAVADASVVAYRSATRSPWDV